MRPKHIGLFGGSFDPVHNAHLALGRHALDELALDELCWVPTGQPWQKARAMTPAVHREAMLRLAIGNDSRSRIERSGFGVNGTSGVASYCLRLHRSRIATSKLPAATSANDFSRASYFATSARSSSSDCASSTLPVGLSPATTSSSAAPGFVPGHCSACSTCR